MIARALRRLRLASFSGAVPIKAVQVPTSLRSDLPKKGTRVLLSAVGPTISDRNSVSTLGMAQKLSLKRTLTLAGLLSAMADVTSALPDWDAVRSAASSLAVTLRMTEQPAEAVCEISSYRRLSALQDYPAVQTGDLSMLINGQMLRIKAALSDGYLIFVSAVPADTGEFGVMLKKIVHVRRDAGPKGAPAPRSGRWW